MKRFKRNAVIITVVLFVCVAAYLNWTYNNNGSTTGADSGVPVEATASDTDAAAPPAPSVSSSDAGLYYSGDSSSADAAAPPSGTQADFFATARLNRQQARDAAAATLATVSQTDGASQNIIDAALAAISKIADDSQKEAELESLIIAKGFTDCVVYLSDDGVQVTVPAPQEGLSQSSVAKITDIITTNTTFKAADLHIIEVK